MVIKTVDRLLGRPEGADLDLITYVSDITGHDMRYAIDSRKLQNELGNVLSYRQILAVGSDSSVFSHALGKGCVLLVKSSE